MAHLKVNNPKHLENGETFLRNPLKIAQNVFTCNLFYIFLFIMMCKLPF